MSQLEAIPFLHWQPKMVYATEKRDWPNLVRHVVRNRVVVELAEGELPVAMLVPIDRPKTMADLDKALRLLPSLPGT